jgi:transposase
LNKVQAFVGFIYEDLRMRAFENDKLEIAITAAPRGGIKARCSNCRQPSTGYDHLPERRWEFMPLWGIPTHCIYARGASMWKAWGGGRTQSLERGKAFSKLLP